MKTFKMGGVHPEENKISSNCVIEQMPLPKQVAILMNQHLGAPATPIVAKGDKVKVGQLIAEAQAFMCANIHSPVSGTVNKIDVCKDMVGLPKTAIYIDTLLSTKAPKMPQKSTSCWYFLGMPKNVNSIRNTKRLSIESDFSIR